MSVWTLDDYDIYYVDGMPRLELETTNRKGSTGQNLKVSFVTSDNEMNAIAKSSKTGLIDNLDIRMYLNRRQYWFEYRMFFRWQDADNYYRLRFLPPVGNSGQSFIIDRIVAGSITNILNTVLGYSTVQPDPDIRVVMFDSLIEIYFSKDGKYNNDPTKSWVFVNSVNDNAITAAGRVGWGFWTTISNAKYVLFDDFFVGSVEDVT